MKIATRLLVPARSSAFGVAGLVLVWSVLTVSAFAQGGAPATQRTPEAGVPIIYRGQEIVRVYRGLGGIGPAERARIASERLHQFVRDPSFDPTRVTVTHSETVSELVYDERVLGVISDEDAQAVGRPRAELAQQVRDRLVEVVTEYPRGVQRLVHRPRPGVGCARDRDFGGPAAAARALYRRVQSRVRTWYRRLTADPPGRTKRRCSSHAHRSNSCDKCTAT